MAKNNNRKKNVAGIFLLLSALLLGVLIVVLVARNKTHMTINGGTEGDRVISGSYPLPGELIESDKTVLNI